MPVKNDFVKLPEKVQERIHIRNNFSDALIDPSADVDKADFLIQLIQEDYTSSVKNDEATRSIWLSEKPRICILVDMVRDYTFKAKKALQEIDKQLDKEKQN